MASSRSKVTETAIVTSTTTVKTGSGKVFWVAATNSHAENVEAIIIRDSTVTLDNNSLPAATPMFQRFDPPLTFETDLNVVVAGSGTGTVTIAYE